MGVRIHPAAVVDEDAAIGDGTAIWHFSHVQSRRRIREHCSLRQSVYVGNGAVVGDGVRIQNNASVYGGVTVEDGYFLGPSRVFTNDPAPCADARKGSAGWLPTFVRRGASIGVNATIVCGCEVGERALVDTGTVVTRDVSARAVVAGTQNRMGLRLWRGTFRPGWILPGAREALAPRPEGAGELR